jgi:6-pyruvoyltetrahydropterin/6-carboxytetrahydropterin synthase
MYTLAVRRDFIARHALIGGDWGAENQPHAHPYLLELRLEGDQLDAHGFLVDILQVEKALEAQLSRYRDRLLNDQPEFAGLNPSLEHFARILCTALNGDLPDERLSALEVVLWENQAAWASYRITR